MQLHQLRPVHKTKKAKRVGRGGAHGSYSGKGLNGQRSRSGRKFKPVIRELIKRYGKLRGYKFKRFAKKPLVFSLEDINKKFESGERVSMKTLIEKGLMRKIKGETPKVKILSNGEIKKALIFENCSVSKGAKEKIGKAGGEIK